LFGNDALTIANDVRSYGRRKPHMCLGVPMRITEIDGFTARCEARGIERTASLFLLQHENLEVGDLVMIHVGNAIQKMSEEEAQTAWDLYDEILDAEAAERGESRAK
jgi:hydrogenase expression/formation protein HypC